MWWAGVAGGWVGRQDFGVGATRKLLGGFLAVIALGSFLGGLRCGYEIERFVPLQRALPLFAGPLVYLGFATLARPEPEARRQTVLHLAVAAGVAVMLPLVLDGWSGSDWAIGVSYLVYAALILRLWRRGENGIPLAPLRLVRRVRLAMLLAAVFLLVSLVGDSAIAVSFALNRQDDAMTMISYGALLMIGVMGALFAVVTSGRAPPETGRTAGAGKSEADLAQLAQAADQLLSETRLYLESDLSVDRLARRLMVPARTLSAAINQRKGQNMSQYVNGFRLRHAAELLAQTDQSVTQVMEQSGFLTRSNFYREFQRSYGQSPAAYRQSVQDGA